MLSVGSSARASSACDAEGERDVLARNVTAAQADGDGNVEAVESAENGAIEEIGRSASRNTIDHFAEDDAANARELAGRAQLPQHAIDLVGLDADVFKKEQLVFGARAPMACRAARREC